MVAATGCLAFPACSIIVAILIPPEALATPERSGGGAQKFAALAARLCASFCGGENTKAEA